MPHCSGKNQNDPIRTERKSSVAKKSEIHRIHSRWNLEIRALLQCGTICLVALIKKQNGPVRTERKITFQRNLKFVEFQAKFRNSGLVTGWHVMPSFSGKK